MRKKTAEEFLAKVEGILNTINEVALGISNPMAPSDEAEREDFKKGFKEGMDLAGAEWQGPGRSKFLAKLKKQLLDAPEPSQAEKEASLALADNIPSQLRRALFTATKNIPHSHGGPPRALKPDQVSAACKKIEAYRTGDEHLDTPEAISRVARELNRKKHVVSEKTLRRIWSKYIGQEPGERKKPAIGFIKGADNQ